MTQIAPSLLSADFAYLARDVETMKKAGADLLHFDVMDGAFVPNISMGIPVLESLNKATELPLDVHLMVEEPHRYVERFIKAGADYLTIHLEAESKIEETLKLIASLGAIPSISIKPGTPVEAVLDYLPFVRMVLIMSVEPGFGGQSFMPNSLEKISYLRRLSDQQHLDLHIEVDGGIDVNTAKQVIDAGADILVAGSALFKAADPSAFIQTVKSY